MGIKNVASKAGLFLRKHSPEILGAIGVVATVGGVIWACKAVLQLWSAVDYIATTKLSRSLVAV